MFPANSKVAGTRLLLVWALGGLVLIDSVLAHPGGGSRETSHLISDIFGYLILAFVLYVGYLAMRQVIYPRLRTFLK